MNIFDVVSANYYDDFPIMDLAVDADDTADMVKEIFDLLGWEVKASTAETKATQCFKALGVVFDLTDMKLGGACIANKPSRTSDLLKTIAEIKASEHMRADVARLRGEHADETERLRSSEKALGEELRGAAADVGLPEDAVTIIPTANSIYPRRRVAGAAPPSGLKPIVGKLVFN